MSAIAHAIGRSARALQLGRVTCLLWLVCSGNSALAEPYCTISSGATLSFGSVVALASTPDQTTNSGTSFWVNCSSEVTSAPSLYSSTTPRALVYGADSIPLALSTHSPGGPELPSASPGIPLDLMLDGNAQTVVLYAKVQSIHFRNLQSGSYGATLSLTLEY